MQPSMVPSATRVGSPGPGMVLRRWPGIGFVAAVVLLQLFASFITNRDWGRFGSVLLLFSVEMPVLFAALDWLFGWAGRRQLKTPALLGLGMVLAGLIGGVLGAGFWALALRFPGLGLHTSTVLPLDLGRMVLFGFTNAQSHFGLWTLAWALPGALEDAKLRRLEAEQLRSSAELTRLRANLEPHFLLNTLNAIAGLVTEDPREARRLLAALGDLLRDALHDGDELETVGAQVAWLKRYAQILEARHRGDLTFTWQVDDAAAGLALPRLLLQPLVENAVKHGALKRAAQGHVMVRVQLEHAGARLACTVEDDGPGLPPGPPREGAFGLQSVRRRLELRYGGQGRLVLDSSAGGTRARVELPTGGVP